MQPHTNFVAVPHWHHPIANHNVTTMSLCPTFPSSVCIASENDAAAVINSGRHRRHTYSCGMCASQKDTTSAARGEATQSIEFGEPILSFGSSIPFRWCIMYGGMAWAMEIKNVQHNRNDGKGNNTWNFKVA